MIKIESLMREGLEDSYGILKLQNVILNIMKYIDELCEKNQIDYYIIGGTALGAVRHGGFIPWDDDLDIAMTRDNYNKFLEVCEKEIDKRDFFLQVGRRDWPLYFSKLRLKGTFFEEEGAGNEIARENRGIFIDIFPFDTASNCKVGRLWQYFSGRLLVANAVGGRGYKTDSLFKKIVIWLAKPLNIKFLRDYFYRQVIRYNSKTTNFIGDFFDSYRPNDASWPKKIWGIPKKVRFETVELYSPQDLIGYLKEYFGDYQELPSVEKRVPQHINDVNYGIYK